MAVGGGGGVPSGGPCPSLWPPSLRTPGDQSEFFTCGTGSLGRRLHAPCVSSRSSVHPRVALATKSSVDGHGTCEKMSVG
ncbi:hypothetical protein NN561_018156 [Cricetulus griseus]